LTLAIFGVVIGYYVFYYAGILRVSRGLRMPSAALPEQSLK